MIPSGDLCPAHLQDALNTYARSRRPVGDFLRACLENNLREAVAFADETNGRLLSHIIGYLWNALPGHCWGSEERVKLWLADDSWQVFTCRVCQQKCNAGDGTICGICCNKESL